MQRQLDSEAQALQSAVAGRYHLEAELGRGGMGIVYLARDVALERSVALKLLPASHARNSSFRERFLREARIAARLSHPNIVPIFSVEEQGELVWFVMAYIAGETLRERVARLGPLPIGEVNRIAREVGWALAHAQGKGVVHRDVKPENVLIERDSGRAVVTDFGIARALDVAGATAVGELVGTPQYLSPEQALGEPVDGRSDLYSLGATLFFALTGRPPFDANGVHALLRMHIEEPAVSVTTLRADVPVALAGAIARCLAKQPAERFESGEALATQLQEGEGIGSGVPEGVMRLRGQVEEAIALVAGGLSMTIPWIVKAILQESGYLFDFSVVYLLVGAVVTGTIVIVALSGCLGGARRLLELGYTRDELNLLLARTRSSQAPLRGAGLIGRFILATAGVFLSTVLLILAEDSRLDMYLWVAASVPTIILSASFVRHALRTPRIADFLAKRFRGRPGRLLIGMAGWRLRQVHREVSGAAQPTEALMGDAAKALFDALPSAYRANLKELPALLARLESSAQRLRQREAELASAIAACGAIGGARGASADPLQESRAQAVEDLERARREISARLTTVLAALEQLRLALVRLRAGVATPETITSELEGVQRISDEVDRLLDASNQVNAMLEKTPG